MQEMSAGDHRLEADMNSFSHSSAWFKQYVVNVGYLILDACPLNPPVRIKLNSSARYSSLNIFLLWGFTENI